MSGAAAQAQFLFLLAAFAALYCGLLILPVWGLARAGFGKSALLVAVALTAGLIVDYWENWDALAYPHWLFSGWTFYFPLTLIAGFVAIGIGLRSVIAPPRFEGSGAVKRPARLP